MFSYQILPKGNPPKAQRNVECPVCHLFSRHLHLSTSFSGVFHALWNEKARPY